MDQQDIQGLLQRLGNHLDELKTLFQEVSDQVVCHKDSPKKWSLKEILGHLFDVELAFSYRLKKVMEEDDPTYPAFDQDKWVEIHEYNHWDSVLLVDSLISLRRNLIFWLGRLKESHWERVGIHPTIGRQSVQSIVEYLSSHYEHHVEQIKERVNK